jgi:hypothetical protein
MKFVSHQARAELAAELEPDRLAFDDSHSGELLRRYEISCSRLLLRTADTLLKLRRPGPEQRSARGRRSALVDRLDDDSTPVPGPDGPVVANDQSAPEDAALLADVAAADVEADLSDHFETAETSLDLPEPVLAPHAAEPPQSVMLEPQDACEPAAALDTWKLRNEAREASLERREAIKDGVSRAEQSGKKPESRAALPGGERPERSDTANQRGGQRRNEEKRGARARGGGTEAQRLQEYRAVLDNLIGPLIRDSRHGGFHK